MNKLVYLFEFDSVKKNTHDILVAHENAFRELVLNGNAIVFSMNQITDSFVFTYAMRNENTYKYIMNLFKKGYLRMALYSNVKTPSQYIQNAIEKETKDGTGTFKFTLFNDIFSVENLDYRNVNKLYFEYFNREEYRKIMLESILTALKFSDSNLVDYKYNREGHLFNFLDWEQLCRCDRIELQKRVEYVKRCIDLVLMMSTSTTKKQLPRDSKFLLCDYIRDVIDITENKNVKEYMTKIYSELNTDSDNTINSRSSWYKKIKLIPDFQVQDECYRIVDICY